MEYFFLKNIPAPYTTECAVKQFLRNEYHCTRLPEYYVLIFMLKNNLHWEEGGVPRTVCAGEWYLQPKNIPQSACSPSSNAEYYYIHLYAESGDSIDNCLKLPQCGTFLPDEFIPDLQNLVLLTGQRPFRFLEAQIQLYHILTRLQENSQGYDTLVYKIIRYLDDHYQSKITSRTLSDVFHYSKEHIELKVKKQLHMTPHAYLTGIRLEKARRLLEYTETPIADISCLTGFGDTSLLFKAFRQRYGMSPSAWRELKYVGVQNTSEP